MPKEFAEFQDLDFEVEKEVWNEYEVHDGEYNVTLKARSILLKIRKPRFQKLDEPPLVGVPRDAPVQKKQRREELQMSYQNIVVVSNCPIELMGSPTPNLPAVEPTKAQIDELDFTPFKEDWNIYKISDGELRLKVKHVVSSITKIKGAYDQFGYPMYFVQSTNAVAPAMPRAKK